MASSAVSRPSGGVGLLSPPQDRKSLKEQEYLSIRHALPKTRISHTILHENPSQERHLGMTLDRVQYRQEKVASSCSQNQRNFIEGQYRKQRKWKKEDEMRRSSMNFPFQRSAEESRPDSMLVVYRSPPYEDNDDTDTPRQGALLPYMKVRRERTEILKYRERTFMTRLPTVIEIDNKKLQRYNTFCGTKMVAWGAPLADDRFKKLTEKLSPRVSSAQVRLAMKRTRRRPRLFYNSDADTFSCTSTMTPTPHSPDFFRQEMSIPVDVRKSPSRASGRVTLPVLGRTTSGGKPEGEKEKE